MKKSLSFLLISAIVLPFLFCLSSCSDSSSDMKLGVGIYTTVNSEDAKNSEKGKAEITATVAAVALDSNGRILSCQLDCAQSTVDFSSDGTFSVPDEFLTKYEKKASYVMPNANREWYKQADVFESLLIGKTGNSIKNLQNEDGKGKDEVLSAGCTIKVDEFIRAVGLAIENAQPKEEFDHSTLSIGVATSAKQEESNGKKGALSLVTTVSATAVDESGTLKAVEHDAVYVDANVNEGKLSIENGSEIKSQLQRTDNDSKSWIEELTSFEEGLVGKTAEDLGKITSDTFSDIISAVNKAIPMK